MTRRRSWFAAHDMRVFRQTIGFAVFAVAIEGLWAVLRIDVAEDLNLFGESPCWPWPIGAVILVIALSAGLERIRRTAARYWAGFGALAVFLAIGVLVPRLIGRDGLAIGMLTFLNIHWTLLVSTYWGLLWGVTTTMERTMPRPSPGLAGHGNAVPDKA